MVGAAKLVNFLPRPGSKRSIAFRSPTHATCTRSSSGSRLDSIPHHHLRAFLDQRVTDGVIRRMIDKWLKAGVLEDGLLRVATEGTPQGGVISPLLSNIYLHHVLDQWFEDEVKPRLQGKASLVRYADDFVMTFESCRDAERVLEVLGKRLGRYGLTLHPDKTRSIDFRPQRRGGTPPGCSEPRFDFLGFTHTWGKSRKGKDVVRQTTAKNRLARALTAINEWCRDNRHRPLSWQHDRLSAKLIGHMAYYGCTGNIWQVGRYRQQVVKLWRKWLERRTRAKRLTWARFNAFLARQPLPRATIVHRHAAAANLSA
jgi:RNA-directed DNA polymerase